MKSMFDNLHDNELKLKLLIDLIEQGVPIHEWGFKLSAKFVAKLRPALGPTSGDRLFPTVIYDSEYCRVLFSLFRDIKGHQLMVAYGRLHAPDDEQIIKWDREDCYCWHWNVNNLILKFLDGMSPQEAIISRGKSPKGLKSFLDLALENTLNDVEFTLRYHSEIWKYYGKSLFELFDLRRPELWEKYARFVKEYYDRYRRPRNVKPSLDKIC